MSEEAKNAAVVIPWTIITTIGSTLILGWGELDVLDPEREIDGCFSDQCGTGIFNGK